MITLKRQFAAIAMGFICSMQCAVASVLDIDFTYTGTGVTASGVLETDGVVDVNGFYLVTGITGTRNGDAITALLNVGDFQSNDNLISLTAPFLTNGGISYVAGGNDYNFYTAGNGSSCSGINLEFNTNVCPPGTNTDIAITLTLTPVPEPASLALLGLGLAGLGFSRRGKM